MQYPFAADQYDEKNGELFLKYFLFSKESCYLRKQALRNYTVQHLPPPQDFLSLFDSAKCDRKDEASRVIMLTETSF